MYLNRNGTARGYHPGLAGTPTLCERARVGLRGDGTGLVFVAGLVQQDRGWSNAQWNAAPPAIRMQEGEAALDRLVRACPTVNPAAVTVVRQQIRAGGLKGVISGESLLKGLAKTVLPVAAVGAAPFVLPALAPLAVKAGQTVWRAGRAVIGKAVAGASAPEAPVEISAPLTSQMAAFGGALPILLGIGLLMAFTTQGKGT